MGMLKFGFGSYNRLLHTFLKSVYLSIKSATDEKPTSITPSNRIHGAT